MNHISMSKSPGTLLIVEDEEGLKKVLRDLLKKTCPRIEVASNGKEALEVIQKGEIDVVVSDLNMPIMNGLELLKNVREAGLEIPFIVLTGYGDKEKAIQALRLGATDFLDKPFDSAEFIQVVKKAAELTQAIREVAEEVEGLYAASKISNEKRIRLKEMKKSILMMRETSKIYDK